MIYTAKQYLSMHSPLNYQTSEYDCGPTSVRNALSYLFTRGEIKPEWLNKVHDITLDKNNGYGGTSNEAMEKVANYFNTTEEIDVKVLKGEEADIDNGEFRKCMLEGCVALIRVWDECEHYVLCTKIKEEKAYIFDPYFVYLDDFDETTKVEIDANHCLEYNRIVDLDRLRENSKETYALVKGEDVVMLLFKKKKQNKKTMMLFDLDGTLWDTLEVTCTNANEFLKEMNIEDKEITLETVRNTMGCSHSEAAFNYFPFLDEETRNEYLTLCSARNSKTLAKVGGKLYPKLEQTLKELGKKYQLAIVSNCSDPYLEAFVTSSGLGDLFVEKMAAGGAKLSKAQAITKVMEKYNIPQEKAIYVGDTIRDYNAATEAGIDCIFCRYGFGDIPDAKYYVDNFEDLVEQMNKIEKEI